MGKSSGPWIRSLGARVAALVGIVAMLLVPVQARAAQGGGDSVSSYDSGLTSTQQNTLYTIARDTWKFYALGEGVDPNTNLPLDNIGYAGAPPRGAYTSPTNIGVYLWSVVAAHDLGLISRPEARSRIEATFTTVQRLTKWHGFLLSWYDTTSGNAITGPGGTSIEGQPLKGQLISNVDNGWYAAGLIVVRQALPEVKKPATELLNAMNFGVFYDNGDENTNITAGQMCGAVIVDTNPCPFHYGLINTEPRITAYIGMGTHTMPSDVWWRTWRVLPSTIPPPPTPPSGCILTGNSNFDWQGQYPPKGYWTSYRDPLSGKCFTILEGHYTYGANQFVPSWGGSMFEGEMPNLVVPETSWGPRSFGLNDKNYAQTQIDWATQGLAYPVWGLSPSSTPDDTGGYDAFGAVGPPYPNAIASNANCCPYQQYAVTPHASFLALDVLPQQAYVNILALRALYPGIYGPDGFFDAVNPKTGSIGHRYLVLDQSMIMAALDNALNNRAMQRHFAKDPVSSAAHAELSTETMSIAP